MGALTGYNLIHLILCWGGGTFRTEGNREELQFGQEVIGFDMVILVVVFFILENKQNVLNARLDIYKSRYQIITIPGAVSLLYQDYSHIAWKHNFIYDSVYIKNCG